MMKRTVGTALVAVAVAVLAAAAGDATPAFQGKWLIDKAATMETMAADQYKNAPPDQQKAMLDGMPDMVVEFTATNASVTAGGGEPQVAAYKVTKADKTTVWLDVTPKKKDATVEKLTLKFATPDSMTMQKEGDPLTLRLNRMK
jgi:hypothetical protein